MNVSPTIGSNSTRWTDITSGGNHAWIVQQALDANASCGTAANGVPERERHVLCNHTSSWLSRHGKSAQDFWYGEVDYVGDCDPQRDIDCDHWDDAHDNCPFVANTDQADTNDDGIGDKCGLCPCDPDDDLDHDLACGPTCAPGSSGCPQWCAGLNPYASQTDNCVYTPNATQDNCNALSEQSQHAAILGDACDPVPCPAVSTDDETTHTICTPNPAPAQNTQQCNGFAVHDVAALQLNGSHVARTDSSVIVGPISLPIPAVPTTARYCQARAFDPRDPNATTFNCRDLRFINDGQLLKETDGRDQSQPWHGIATVLGGGGIYPPDASFELPYGLEASDAVVDFTTASSRWLYTFDLARWIANTADPTIPLPFGNSTCTGAAHEGNTASTTCLNGTLWFHGDTLVGGDLDHAVVRGALVGTHAPQLVNGYADIVVDDNVIGYCPTTSTEFQTVAQAAARRSGAPSPIMISAPGIAGAARRGFDVRSTPDSEFLTTTSIGVAALQDTGTVIATQNLGTGGVINCGGSSVTQGLSARFVGNLGWVNAVEPDVRIGRHPEYASFVVSNDGTRIVDTAIADGTGLRSASQFCDHCTASAAPAALDAGPTGPSPRKDFVAFYSRAANAVVVTGGDDLATNAILHDVWLYDLFANTWEGIPIGGLGRIVDATYSFGDKKFWLLDRVARQHGPDEIRLVRFDRSGGNLEVVRSWAAGAVSPLRLFLSLDRDGAILLSAANRTSYVVTRVTIPVGGNRARSHVVDAGYGELVYRPVVSRVSYAFLLRGRNDSARIVRRVKLALCNDDDEESDRDRRAFDEICR